MCVTALRRFNLVLVGMAVALVSVIGGCYDGVITFTNGNASVRIFNGQTKSAAMTVEIDTQLQIASLANGTVSEQFSLSSGLYHSFFCQSTTDSTTLGIIANQRYMFADNAKYTMVVHGLDFTDFVKPVLDSSVSPFPSKAAIRIINATDTSICNVFVDTIKINDKPADIQTATRLFAAPPGIYTITTYNSYSNAEIDHRSVNLVADRCYNLIIYDAVGKSGVLQKVAFLDIN